MSRFRTLGVEVVTQSQVDGEQQGAKLATDYFGETPWALDRSEATPLLRNLDGSIYAFTLSLHYHAISEGDGA